MQDQRYAAVSTPPSSDPFHRLPVRGMMKEDLILVMGDSRRSPMIKAIAICGTFLLTAVVTKAQEKPAVPRHHMNHVRNGGFMCEGTHHAVATGATHKAKANAAAHQVTPRGGRVNFQADTK